MGVLWGETAASGPKQVLVDALGAVVVSIPDWPVTVVPVIGAGSDFTLDAGDVVTATAEIPAAVRAAGGTCLLTSLTIACSADIAPPLSVIFFNAATALGTVDAAPSIDAAGNKTIVGWVDVAASDWKDLGSVRNACVRNVNLEMKAGAATTSLYFAVLNGSSSAAFAAADALQFVFGLLRS